MLSLFVVTCTEFPQPGAGQEKAIYHRTEAHWEVVWMSVKRTKKAPRELTNSEEPPGGKRNMPVLLTIWRTDWTPAELCRKLSLWYC